MSAQKQKVSVKGVGGNVTQDAMYWINQNLTCQASRVTIKKITRLKLGNLDYDMIIGLPFIQRYQPQVNWRTGKLKFKKFSWAQEPELFQRAGINIIAAAEIEKEFVQKGNPKMFRNTHDKSSNRKKYENPIEALIFVKLTDVIAMVKAIEPDEERDTTFDLKDVPPDKQHKVLNPKLSPEKKKQILALLEKVRKLGILSDKDNLPHATTGFAKQPEEWAFPIPSKPGVEPPHHKPRRMSRDELKECYRQLKWFITHGFIEPSKST